MKGKSLRFTRDNTIWILPIVELSRVIGSVRFITLLKSFSNSYTKTIRYFLEPVVNPPIHVTINPLFIHYPQTQSRSRHSSFSAFSRQSSLSTTPTSPISPGVGPGLRRQFSTGPTFSHWPGEQAHTSLPEGDLDWLLLQMQSAYYVGQLGLVRSVGIEWFIYYKRFRPSYVVHTVIFAFTVWTT